MHAIHETNKTQILNAYKIWFRQNLAECTTAEERRALFTRNWALTKGTFLCPTALPDRAFVQEMCVAAETIDVLFPEVVTESLNNDIFPDLDSLNLFTVCQTHILSDDQRYLLPAKLLSKTLQDNNPYYDAFEEIGNIKITQDEWHRIEKHSEHTLNYHARQREVKNLLSRSNNLWNKLTRFCEQLRLNDYQVRGGHQDAGLGAYPAIIEFYGYYRQLSDLEKNTIPLSLRDELQILFDLSTNAQRNYNATEVFETCIHLRRNAINTAMQPHRALLETIGVNGEQANRQIRDAEAIMATSKARVEAPDYSGCDHLGFNAELLNALGVRLEFRTLADVEFLHDFNAQKFDWICREHGAFLGTLRGFDEFSNFSAGLSPQKLTSLGRLDLSQFLVDDNRIQEWLLRLSTEQLIGLMNSNSRYPAPNVIIQFIKTNKPQELVSMIQASDDAVKLAYFTQTDHFGDSLLFSQVLNPERFLESLAFINDMNNDLKYQVLSLYNHNVDNILINTIKTQSKKQQVALIHQIIGIMRPLSDEQKIGILSHRCLDIMDRGQNVLELAENSGNTELLVKILEISNGLHFPGGAGWDISFLETRLRVPATAADLLSSCRDHPGAQRQLLRVIDIFNNQEKLNFFNTHFNLIKNFDKSVIVNVLDSNAKDYWRLGWRYLSEVNLNESERDKFINVYKEEYLARSFWAYKNPQQDLSKLTRQQLNELRGNVILHYLLYVVRCICEWFAPLQPNPVAKL
jgi:hypothetical protein